MEREEEETEEEETEEEATEEEETEEETTEEEETEEEETVRMEREEEETEVASAVGVRSSQWRLHAHDVRSRSYFRTIACTSYSSRAPSWSRLRCGPHSRWNHAAGRK